MNTRSRRHLDRTIARYPELELCRTSIQQAVQLICDCHRAHGKLLIAGNGGSAADSDHIVGELVKSFALPRKIGSADCERLRVNGSTSWELLANQLQRGVSAVALTGHAALSTAIQNDTSAAMVFAQQVYVHGRPGDIFIGLSTSGNSANVVLAMETARAFGLHTIGLTGSRPGKMDQYCDLLLKVPASDTPSIQEFHLPIYHAICLMVEEELFGGDHEPVDDSS